MQKIGNIINQINRRNMETETFECSFKRAFEKDNGGVTVYVTKDDGTDMTIYGEAMGTSRWQKGARLKIEALPIRTSKSGKQYQTANSIELLDGEVAVPTNNMVKVIIWVETIKTTTNHTNIENIKIFFKENI